MSHCSQSVRVAWIRTGFVNPTVEDAWMLVVYTPWIQVVDVPAGGDMLKMARTVTLGEYEFEGTPSRDSLRYISIFGIEGVKTLVRGLYKHKVLYIYTHNTHTYILTHIHAHTQHIHTRTYTCTQTHTHTHACTHLASLHRAGPRLLLGLVSEAINCLKGGVGPTPDSLLGWVAMEMGVEARQEDRPP